MKNKYTKKDLRTFASMVKAPKIVVDLFTEVESEVKTVVVFGISTIGREKLLTATLFNQQGCFAVAYFRKTGEAISYEIDSKKFKQEHVSNVLYGPYTAWVNLKSISKYFNTDDNEPRLYLIRRVNAYKEKSKIEKQKQKSRENLEYFKGLSPIPTNFKNWCKRDFARIVFTTADRHHGYCQYCETEIETKDKLVQGYKFRCPQCKQNLVAISESRLPWRREKGFALFGELNGIPVIRHFLLTYYKSRNIKTEFFEYERDVLVNDNKWYYRPFMRSHIGPFEFWRDYKKYPNLYGTGDREIYWEGEALYPYSDFSLLSDKLQKLVHVECGNLYRWEYALTSEVKNLEMANILNAAGYSKELAYGVYNHYTAPENVASKYYTPRNIVSYGRNPKEILQLDGNFAKLFKDRQYGYLELECYESFRKKTKEGNSPKAFSTSLLYASDNIRSYEKYLELLNEFNLTVARMNKYFKERPDSRTFGLWFDYLRHYRDAAKLSNKRLSGKSWMFPPVKDIEKKHDEAVKWYKLEYDEKLKKERQKKEEALQKFVSGLSELDNYEVDGMIAKIPHTYGDFVEEGSNNHNCVGDGWYYDRMVEAKSIIVFLRTKEGKSYCTCEFTFENGEIKLRQCRLKSNTDAPDTVHRSAEKYGMLLQKQLLLNQAVA